MEIIGKNLSCNLSEIHLNQIDTHNFEEQKSAFTAGALSVAALLQRPFHIERYQQSREFDPIVAVCPTGLFDFFVNLLGVSWLQWWQAGRPDKWMPTTDFVEKTTGAKDRSEIFKRVEKTHLEYWRDCVHEVVWNYCDKHNLKRPNRCTAFQPSGTKSLLTGASSGWHPPKAQRYIRRITFTAHDPVAMACVDYGYNIIPSQSCKDENGKLLDDPFDPRVEEWLVEIPVEVPWANLPGADQIDISQFSAAAQFDFYMQCQRYYTTHNTSGTIELREGEIKEVGSLIHNAIQNDLGYISCALLARFDAKETYPRLPFEPISKETYDELQRQVLNRRETEDFQLLLNRYDYGWNRDQGVTGCDSDKCLMK